MPKFRMRLTERRSFYIFGAGDDWYAIRKVVKMKSKKLYKMLGILLALLLVFSPVVQAKSAISDQGASTLNNPFTYRYEYDPLVYKGKTRYTKQDIENYYRMVGTVGSIMDFAGSTNTISFILEGMARLLNPIKDAPGYLKIYTGEKRKIATSGITGKSHVAQRWLTYRMVFVSDSKGVVLDKKGETKKR